MKLPKFTAHQSLDSPVGWFYGRAICLEQQGVGIISDLKCLFLAGLNVLYCQNCLCADLDCFVTRS